MKETIEWLIAEYENAISQDKEDFFDYVENKDLDAGVCYKLQFSDKSKEINKLGIGFIENNTLLFDEQLLPLKRKFWFGINTFRCRDYDLALKSLEARKLVLENILKSL